MTETKVGVRHDEPIIRYHVSKVVLHQSPISLLNSNGEIAIQVARVRQQTAGLEAISSMLLGDTWQHPPLIRTTEGWQASCSEKAGSLGSLGTGPGLCTVKVVGEGKIFPVD